MHYSPSHDKVLKFGCEFVGREFGRVTLHHPLELFKRSPENGVGEFPGG